ncbi:MAG: DUF7557 family protein [Nitrosotalea sp.]
MVTSIQLQEKTKHKLEELKSYPRETYNEVIERLLETRVEKDTPSPQTVKKMSLH